MVSLNIKKVLLLISLMNAIAAYSNDTSYSYLYSSGIDSTPSYSISAMYATESSNDANGETSNPETTTLAGQYSESGRISTNREQSSTTSQQYTTAAITVGNSDFMSKSTTIATPSSSRVPTSIQATSEASSSLQIHSFDTTLVSKSELSESSSSLSTSDGTTVPRGTNPITTTTFSSSKGEIISTQTSGASRTASLAQVVPESSQLSRMTLTTTTHVSSGEITQTQFFSTISSMISTEDYTIDDFSEFYDSGFTNYPGEELIVEYSSSSPTTIILSSNGETTSTPTSDASHAASVSQVVLGASQLSHIASTATTYSASTTKTQPFNSISSIRSTQASSTTKWETSEDDGSVFTKYPNQELIVDDPSSSTLTRAVSSSMIGQSTPAESNSITISSNLGQNSIVTSISTSSTIPSPSSFTSSPAAVAPSGSAVTSSPAAFASSGSAVTSSPAAVASSTSFYTSSPAAVDSSASSYTSSPAASASSAFSYRSSPAAAASSASAVISSPAAVAPSYTSSTFTYGLSASTQTSSPSSYPPSSSPTTYAPGLSPVRSLSTAVTVTPVISVHTMSSKSTTSSQQVPPTPYKTTLQSRPISSISSDVTFSTTVSVTSIGSFASNRVETTPLSSPTQLSSTYVAESPKSNTPLTQLSSGTEASYIMSSQNIASSSKLTTARQSNIPYVSSMKTSDNGFFSTTLQASPTGSTKMHTFTSSTSTSRHSMPQIAASDVSGSSKDPGSHITSLYHSASSVSSKKYSKETNIVTQSFSETHERLTGSTRTYQSNSQPSISNVKTTVNTQSHVLTTALSKSTKSKAGSTSSSNKLPETITDSRGKLSLTTTKTSHDSSLKTGESNSGVSTKLSTGTISIATQTQAITASTSITAVPFTYATNPYTTSNDYAWLPTAIIVEPTKSDTSTTSFNPSITASLPNVIAPAIAVTEPANHTLITIGFTAGLNYVFLVQNPLSSAQIFNFLPLVLKYPFSDTTSQQEESSTYEMGSSSFVLSYQSGSSTTTLSPESVSSIPIVRKKKKKGGKNSVMSTANLDLPSIGNSSIVVKQIVPMIDSSRSYVIAVAEVYFPTEAISSLQELILDTNSTLYNNPQTSLQTLAGLIDSSVPLGGLTLYGSNNGCSICDSSSSSVSEVSNTNSTKNGGTNKYGALDDFTNSLTDHMPWRITKRFIIYLTCLTAGVLLWLLLALFAFRHRNVLLGRRPSNCIEKTPNNERGLEGVGVSTSRSSSDNHNYNEKKPNTESESFYSMEDDQYIPTGENTVYSATHGLHYTVDEDGDLFYRKSMPNDIDEINENEDSGIDSILRECVYDRHQDTTEVYLNDEESMSSILDVDENGNIRLYDSYSEDDEPNCPHLQEEVIEDYNNSHVYKMQLQGLEIGSYTTEDDPDTENLIANEFSSGSQTCLPSTAYTTPLDTNSIKLHILGHAGSSLQKPDQAFISNHDELEIEDIDDNGSVSDIQVEELDALDEELYKRMSKIVKQQNN